MGQGRKEFWRKNRLKILFDFRGIFVYDTTTKRQNTDHKNYALHYSINPDKNCYLTKDYMAEVNPPSTFITKPVTNEASSEAKNTAAGPISSSRPHRPTGVLSWTQRVNFSSSTKGVFISVAKKPGAMQLTVM